MVKEILPKKFSWIFNAFESLKKKLKLFSVVQKLLTPFIEYNAYKTHSNE